MKDNESYQLKQTTNNYLLMLVHIILRFLPDIINFYWTIALITVYEVTVTWFGGKIIWTGFNYLYHY